MARSVIKIILIVLMIGVLVAAPALASMPSVRGANYPSTVYLDRGIKGSVSGKVVSSLDQTQGIEGAYVAVVDVMNQNKEYANTTTNANGEYTISGLGATYSSTRHWGRDDSAGTLEQSMNMFMIYVNKSGFDEQYSSTFGIDANHTSTRLDPIAVYAGAPGGEPTPEPTATPQPTVMPTVVVPTVFVPTPEPATVTPEPAGLLQQLPVTLIAVVALLAILAVVAVVVYFRFVRKGLMKRVKKK